MNSELLKQLIDNAFDFLETAIDQFEKKPKYSVINFCAAVELLLKARLMHEHWSLIISTKGHPDINQFRSGNFKSINFSELIPRITSVTDDYITKDTIECFKKLANHRNKMIHFFHEAHGHQKKNELLEEIAIEQCSGWFFLRRLLDKWKPIFGNYDGRIDTINSSMKAHQLYLNTVYDRIKPELKKAQQQGTIFIPCSRCKKETSEEFQRTEHIFEYKCRVCLSTDEFVKTSCLDDQCDGEIKIKSFDPDLTCSKCHSEIDLEILKDLLETNGPTTDNYFEYPQTNCAACGSLDTVVENDNNYFICTSCFYFTKQDIGHCSWCNERQIGGGDLEHSYWSGCEFCDGKSAYVKDD